MNYNNEISIEMSSLSINESFARVSIVSFISPLDPSINDVNDIKTALSEAVTNAIIHGYEDMDGKVYIKYKIDNYNLTIEVVDKGRGINNINEAMEPLYTSKPEMERSGMGFTVMESFMDKVNVTSEVGVGTTITMYKDLSKQ